MAKFDLRIKARELRAKGQSVKTIAQELGVAKSTASLWVRDIILSVEQMENLLQNSLKGAELGRLRSALLQKERRLKIIEEAKEFGKNTLANITDREFLIAGLALYWGEGSKKSREFSFCNSDPEMVKFLILWLKKAFNVELKDLKCSVGINEIHLDREELVRRYWSDILKVPLIQFTKTSFKKTNNKKIYQNHEDHYGTIRVKVARSGNIYYKTIGLIEGLKLNMPG